MSESLTKLAAKIDFSKTGCEDIKKEPEATENGEEESTTKEPYQSAIWPWDSVRTKLR